MRRLILLAALPLAACSFASDSDDGKPGIAGTGSGSSRAYQVADFTKVTAQGADDVAITRGERFAVRAQGDPATLDALKIERDGDTLKIGRRRGAGFDWRGHSARVFVTMPRIAAATTEGTGDITIDRVDGDAFTGSSAGAGRLAIGALAVKRASFSLAGAGGVTATGTAQDVDVSITGAGDVKAHGLKATGAKVSITGAGNVTMTVDGAAEVSIMGSGDVDLGPAARCRVSRMGAGAVRCGN